jgi:hypothetical protein
MEKEQWAKKKMLKSRSFAKRFLRHWQNKCNLFFKPFIINYLAVLVGLNLVYVCVLWVLKLLRRTASPCAMWMRSPGAIGRIFRSMCIGESLDPSNECSRFFLGIGM